MAQISGTVWSVDTIQSEAVTGGGGLQVAEVLFTLPSTSTYAQADNGIVSAVATAIQNSRRNGKTVTLVDAMVGMPATTSADPTAILGLKTVAVSGADVTFEVTDGDFTTEFADSTPMKAQDRPFHLLVSFTEA